MMRRDAKIDESVMMIEETQDVAVVIACHEAARFIGRAVPERTLDRC